MNLTTETHQDEYQARHRCCQSLSAIVGWPGWGQALSALWSGHRRIRRLPCLRRTLSPRCPGPRVSDCTSSESWYPSEPPWATGDRSSARPWTAPPPSEEDSSLRPALSRVSEHLFSRRPRNPFWHPWTASSSTVSCSRVPRDRARRKRSTGRTTTWTRRNRWCCSLCCCCCCCSSTVAPTWRGSPSATGVLALRYPLSSRRSPRQGCCKCPPPFVAVCTALCSRSSPPCTPDSRPEVWNSGRKGVALRGLINFNLSLE